MNASLPGFVIARREGTVDLGGLSAHWIGHNETAQAQP